LPAVHGQSFADRDRPDTGFGISRAQAGVDL